MPTAEFLGKDGDTLGDWIGTFGDAGYSKYEGSGPTLVESLASGVTWENPGYGFGLSVRESPSTRPGAPERADGSGVRDLVTMDTTALRGHVITPRPMVFGVYVFIGDATDESNVAETADILIRNRSTNALLASAAVTRADQVAGSWFLFLIDGDCSVDIDRTSGSGSCFPNMIALSEPEADPLEAGAASVAWSGPGQIRVTAAAASGGVGAKAYQWKRKAGAGAYASLAGATGLSFTDTTAVAGVQYTYRLDVTDSAPGTPNAASSNEVPAQVYEGGFLGGPGGGCPPIGPGGLVT